MRSENAKHPEIASSHWDDVSHPSLGGERETQDGWDAAGISGRVIFAACLGWETQNKLSQK
ncbi:MAG: hypothetical protein EPN89_13725 [Methylovulum sp.]|nr:MAG: hypothetical protein EPN89_13725 [Methylovulum sp.]